MSLKLSGSSINPGTELVTKHSMGVVCTEGSKYEKLCVTTGVVLN